MTNLHYLVKSMNVLNCLLALALAAAAHDIVVPYLNFKVQSTLPAVGKAATDSTIQPLSLPVPPFQDYTIVSEQNLFHPQRRIPPEKIEEKATVAAAPFPKPELVLYGTLIADDLSIAYVEDRKAPYSTPGRGKRQTQLKKGDSIGGYLLQEIEPTHIVLVRGEDKLVVSLDEKDRKRSVETAAPVKAAAPAGGLPTRSGAPAPPRRVTPSSDSSGSPVSFPATARPPAPAGASATSRGTPRSATTAAPPGREQNAVTPTVAPQDRSLPVRRVAPGPIRQGTTQ